MQAYFIFNNLKVNTFALQDQPFPGFELLTWEHETFVDGTLWDLGVDAGYTPIGITQIYGQIWLAHDSNQISEFEYFVGAKSGLTEPMRTKCYVLCDGFVDQLSVIIYRLREIKTIYNVVPDGRWIIKRA